MKKILDVTNKPYNKCFACGHLKTPRCNGPRTSSMTLKEWCGYMKDLRDLFGLTNEWIAEQAEVSIKTINKIMARNIDQDIMRETARRIEDVILGNESQAPCFLVFEEEKGSDNLKLDEALAELERASSDVKDYQNLLDNIHNSYNSEMSIVRDEAQRKIQYLLAEIEILRKDLEYWRGENERKSKIIDKYFDKYLNSI